MRWRYVFHHVLGLSSDIPEAAASATPGESTPRVRKVTFVDEDDPFRVASSSRPPIARMSSNAWVGRCPLAKLISGGMWWRSIHFGVAW
jgi:hypothetical protein